MGALMREEKNVKKTKYYLFEALLLFKNFHNYYHFLKMYFNCK